MSTNNRIYLIVPYAEKEVAKAAGCRWDADKKSWYYTGADLPEALKRFIRLLDCGTAPRIPQWRIDAERDWADRQFRRNAGRSKFAGVRK